MRVLWRAGSGNEKTGNVPTGWIGETREETKRSCAGCRLLGCGCYAWRGRVGMAVGKLQAAAAREPEWKYSLKRALLEAPRSAKMARLAAIGDPGRLGKEMAAEITTMVRGAGMALVGYTQHWREEDVAASWRGRIMASCLTVEEADEAAEAGWRVAVVVPRGAPRKLRTPGGRTAMVCPAQIKPKAVTCNNCRLCDAGAAGPIVAFWPSGQDAGMVDEIIQRIQGKEAA